MLRFLCNKTSVLGHCQIFGCILMLSLFLSVANSYDTYAYSATMTINGSVSTTVNPTENVNTTITTDEIGITTNCRAGYNLTISGPSDRNLYLNGNSSINASGSYFSPVDGTSTLANQTNAWGYSLTESTDSGIFTPLPSGSTTIKNTSQTASETDINDTVPIYYGVSTSKVIAPGLYKMSDDNTIVYQLTMDGSCDGVDVTYDDNGADAGDMAITYPNIKEGDTISLVPSNYSRVGYGFAGWSADQNAGTKLIDDDNTNNPIVYGPQEKVTISAEFLSLDTNNDGIINLYAVWIPSQGSLQRWIGCSELDTTAYDSTTGALDLTKNNITALTDQRDNNTYAVARLADGNCWMIENFRLSNNNSDNTTGVLSQGYGGQFAGLANSESSWWTNSTDPNSLYSTNGENNTINIGESNAGVRFPRYSNTDTTEYTASAPTSGNANIYSYGNHYTWHAAIADTTHRISGDITATSICPRGWHVPLGEGRNKMLSFGYLDQQINFNSEYESKEAALRWRQYPNNMVFSSINYKGTSGVYWTATAGGGIFTDSAFEFSISTNGVNAAINQANHKSYAYSVRCVTTGSPSYTIKYNPNGGSGTMPDQSVAANTTTNLSPNSFSPPTKGSSYQNADGTTIPAVANNRVWVFWGWNTKADGTGDWYKNNESIINIGGNTDTFTFYAQWKQATLEDLTAGEQINNEKIIDHNTMQDMTAEVCYNSTAHSIDTNSPANTPYNASTNPGGYHTTTLLDYRGKITTGDNPEAPDQYTVAKLADDNCWMTSDLKLGSTERAITVTSADTDTVNDFTIPIVETSATKTQWGTSNSADGLDVAHAYKYNNTKTVYNWYTATAGTTYTELNASNSICPSNWSLFTKSQAEALVSAIGEAPNSANISAITDPPISLSNGYYNSTTQTAYANKVYWTANGWQNSSSVNFGYYFGIGSNTIRTTYGYQKMMGLGVRCIANLGKVTINYNGNGTNEYPVTGSVSPQTNVSIDSATISHNGFYRTGWGFKEWNTAADGSGVSIPAGTPIISLDLAPSDTITLYAQWVPRYTIQYDGNGSNNDGGGMGSTDANTGVKTVAHINVAEGSTFDLFAPNFKRTGYGFVGWSLDPDAWNHLTDNDTTNDAKIWGPNEVFTAPAYNGNSIVTLYAVWAPASENNGSPVYLQNWTGCSAMTATSYDSSTGKLTVSKDSITVLTDQRDGNVYTVAKLADDNCWMIENLRLNNTPELSTTNTNISTANSTLPITNEYNNTTSNYLSATSNSWCQDTSLSCISQSRLNTTNTTTNIVPSLTQSVTYANAHVNFDNTIYSYGNYYNWYSATAGYGTYSKDDSAPTDGDLCPAGWKLPYGSNGTSGSSVGNTKGGFYYLANQMGGTSSNQVNSNKFRMFPNNFIYSGYWDSNSAGNRGGFGGYWSSSAFSNDDAHALFLRSASVSPGFNYDYKYYGFAVRCVAGT